MKTKQQEDLGMDILKGFENMVQQSIERDRSSALPIFQEVLHNEQAEAFEHAFNSAAFLNIETRLLYIFSMNPNFNHIILSKFESKQSLYQHHYETETSPIAKKFSELSPKSKHALRAGFAIVLHERKTNKPFILEFLLGKYCKQLVNAVKKASTVNVRKLSATIQAHNHHLASLYDTVLIGYGVTYLALQKQKNIEHSNMVLSSSFANKFNSLFYSVDNEELRKELIDNYEEKLEQSRMFAPGEFVNLEQEDIFDSLTKGQDPLKPRTVSEIINRISSDEFYYSALKGVLDTPEEQIELQVGNLTKFRFAIESFIGLASFYDFSLQEVFLNSTIQNHELALMGFIKEESSIFAHLDDEVFFAIALVCHALIHQIKSNEQSDLEQAEESDKHHQLEAQIASLEAQLASQQLEHEQELNRLKMEAKGAKALANEAKQAAKKERSKNTRLTQKYGELQAAFLDLSQSLADEEQPETTIAFDEMVQYLQTKDISLFGGWIHTQRLEKYLPNARFFSQIGEVNRDVSSAKKSDMIFVNYEWFMHAKFDQTKLLAKQAGIPLGYVAGTNAERIIRKMYELMKANETK